MDAYKKYQYDEICIISKIFVPLGYPSFSPSLTLLPYPTFSQSPLIGSLLLYIKSCSCPCYFMTFISICSSLSFIVLYLDIFSTFFEKF